MGQRIVQSYVVNDVRSCNTNMRGAGLTVSYWVSQHVSLLTRGTGAIAQGLE